MGLTGETDEGRDRGAERERELFTSKIYKHYIPIYNQTIIFNIYTCVCINKIVQGNRLFKRLNIIYCNIRYNWN